MATRRSWTEASPSPAGPSSTQGITDDAMRVRLVQLLPLIFEKDEQIIVGMTERIAPLDSGETIERRNTVASILVELLIRCASDIASFGGIADLGKDALDHRRLGIGGRDYTRFGYALTPVLREAVGPHLSPSLLSAASDAFWLLVQEINRAAVRQEDLQLS